MALVKTAQPYFSLVYEYRIAPENRKKILLCGPIAQACRTLEPALLQSRLRRFWEQEAAKLQLDTTKWKSWA